MIELLKTIVLGIVEGVTEFLPISSTGHLIVCEKLLPASALSMQFWQTFTIFIQIGAIASVVVYFRQRIAELLRGTSLAVPLEVSAVAQSHAPSSGGVTSTPTSDCPVTTALPLLKNRVLWLIVLASLPLGIAFVADKWAEKNMEKAWIVAAALAIGGVLMIGIEWLCPPPGTRRMEEMTWRQALGIGLCQILAAIFPGTSRSAATIMGGMVGGLSREAAAEFSFFLAIPAMSAACGYKLLKFLKDGGVSAQEILLLVIGTLVSFLVAWAVIAAFMSYIRRHSFVSFAVYRMLLGAAVLAMMK